MDEYQTLERNGVQELVRVWLDEQGTPCVYLRDINTIFPNTQLITSCGAPVDYLFDPSGRPRQPLRIPYLENRVLEVHGEDVEQITWSRADLRTSTAFTSPSVVSATASASNGHHSLSRATTTTTTTSALDDFSMLESEEEDFEEGDLDDDGEREDNEVLQQFEDDDEDQRHSVLATSHNPVLAPSHQSPPSAATTRPPPVLSLVEQGLISEPPDSLPCFEEALRQGLELRDNNSSNLPAAERSGVPELEPPPYESFSSSSANDQDHQPAHLLPERINLIKQVCQSIFRQQYLATSCPHPPLFVLLPADPMHWSTTTDILHNRMSLYFLCDAGFHSTSLSSPSSQRNVHIVEDSGIELSLEEDSVRQFVAKFSHYMLYLLRMFRYGVTLDDIFVAAVYNNASSGTPTTTTTISSSSCRETTSSRTLLFGAIRDNVDRAIQFLEAYLGDDYDGDDLQSQLIRRLSPEDFRVLDQVLAKSTVSRASEKATERTLAAGDKKQAKRPPDNIKNNGTDVSQAVHQAQSSSSSSGLYRTLASSKYARWCCATHYNPKASMDDQFAQRARTVAGFFDPRLRSLAVHAVSKDVLMTRALVAMKIKDLVLLDVTLDWNLNPDDLFTLERALQSEYSSVASLTLRLGPQAAPLTIQSLESTQRAPWPNLPRDRVIHAILGLLKNPRIKSVQLDGDVDVLQVPQINTQDFSNLDRLSLMRQKTLEGSNCISGGDSKTTTFAETMVSYHRLLRSFFESCAFLSSVELGFPKMVPGHIRILQVCSYSLTSLRHLDLYRVLGPRPSTTPQPAPSQGVSPNGGIDNSSNNSGSSATTVTAPSEKAKRSSPQSSVPEADEWRKLELSATFRASRVIRLELFECRTNADNKGDFVESLRELLHFDGAHLEELDLRYVGFNDSHAEALEEATRPKSSTGGRRRRKGTSRTAGSNSRHEAVGDGHYHVNNCRLRKLVLHGQGITRKGARALSEVLARATEPRPCRAHDVNDSDDDADAADTLTAAPGAPLPNLSPFSTFEYPRLGHLELRSIDSIDDAGWAELVSKLHLSSLITLDLHGFWFGSRGLYSLASCESLADGLPSSSSSSSSSPSSPTLPLRILRLNCSTLDRSGVQQFQAWMPRLKHLTTLGLYGFRNIDPDLWLELLPTIQYRWLEQVEFVCSGIDDRCADRMSGFFCERDPHLPLADMADQPPPPAYSLASPASPSSPSSFVSLSSSSSLPSSPSTGSTPKRRTSSIFSRPSISLSRSSKDLASATSSSSTTSELKNETEVAAGGGANKTLSKPVQKPFKRLLEIDLRYTDVSRTCLLRLKDRLQWSAQTVRVLLRDDDDETEDAAAAAVAAVITQNQRPGPYTTSTAGPPLPLLTGSGSSGVPSTSSALSSFVPLSLRRPASRSTAGTGTGATNSSPQETSTSAGTLPRRTAPFGFLRK